MFVKGNERVEVATAAAVAETMRNAGSPSIFGLGKCAAKYLVCALIHAHEHMHKCGIRIISPRKFFFFSGIYFSSVHFID
jgi:hypothetical protein